MWFLSILRLSSHDSFSWPCWVAAIGATITVCAQQILPFLMKHDFLIKFHGFQKAISDRQHSKLEFKTLTALRWSSCTLLIWVEWGSHDKDIFFWNWAAYKRLKIIFFVHCSHICSCVKGSVKIIKYFATNQI